MSLEKYPYVVIFIPAFNEADSIGEVIKKIQASYVDAKDKGYWVEIIVVNDGSTDKTVQIAGECGIKTIVSHSTNRGLGAATRSGMKKAYEMGADVAVKIDADFQHDPDDIDKVVRPIIEDRADSVFGSRLTGGLKYKMPLYRALGNRFFSWLVSRLTGLHITDAQTGLMAFGKRYLKEFEIVADYNETQQLIIDSWARDMRVLEVPVVFHKRQTGASFISWRYPFKVLPTILRLFIRINPLKFFVYTGLIFILIGILLGISLLFIGEGKFGDTTTSLFVMGGIQIIFFGLLVDLLNQKR